MMLSTETPIVEIYGQRIVKSGPSQTGQKEKLGSGRETCFVRDIKLLWRRQDKWMN